MHPGLLAIGLLSVVSDSGCVSCHTHAGDPHPAGRKLSCVGCHGGDAAATTKEQAHPLPRYPEGWPSSANPPASYSLLNRESPEWVRFVNPGDLRVADRACGGCHQEIVRSVKKTSMATSAQVYSTALYNNAAAPFKDAFFGENYSPDGHPQAIRTLPPPRAIDVGIKGILPILWPLPRFEMGIPGNVFRPFERGGGLKSEVGNPNRDDVPGQPDVTLTNRGPGTQAAVDPVVLGLQKTRLNDPILFFLGTNDAPGDYRSSGCSACHFVYANDREAANSAHFARHGNRGLTQTDDPTIPKDEPGHPLKHEFTRSIPSSQCMTCHVHNGNAFLNTFLGYMWWDQQTDGEHLYPSKQRDPTASELDRVGRSNPEEAAARGLWHDRDFLEQASDLNRQLRKVQLSDYHGHGWIFRKVFKQDRKGNYLDAQGNSLAFEDPELWKKAVHLKDAHLEKGMHCVDCHFQQDVHGSGKIYGDRRAAVEIDCRDCHGTVRARATLITSGPASPGTDLTSLATPFGAARFTLRREKVVQNSMVTRGLSWEVPQVVDIVDPSHPRYNEKARLAKTIQRDGRSWGDGQASASALAHDDSRLTCYACHSSWITNCFGCHLSAKVNTRRPMLHNEGEESQVYASYNPQVLRTDSYMLGIDGTVEKHRVVPVRSSSAVTLSVQNANREWILNQVPTISAAGYNGQAFNTHAPHTVRRTETKRCTDCHLSRDGNNNAWMASLLMLGTNQVNFMGNFVYLAQGEAGLSAVRVTEQSEPQAVFGSHLHRLAYPQNYRQHQERGGKLSEAQHHRRLGSNQVQLYGEYLLSAAGPQGFVAYDVANVANKGFSQGVVISPFSDSGLRVPTRDATGVAVGSSAPLDPSRTQLLENEEQPVARLFGYAFVSDRVEGLITVDITTLVDGDPTNNRLKRAATVNPEGKLTGANSVTLAGNFAYLTTRQGLFVVDVSHPDDPRLVAQLGPPELTSARSVAVQFRYAFVCDDEGMKVVDVTFPERPRLVPGARVPLAEANRIYVARTYAYVAAGASGIAIIDVERPERPRLDQTFDAGGRLNDARDLKVGMTNVSLFAYVADGRNGLQVVELTSPETVPGNLGFSPRPAPRWVAHFPTAKPAVGISEGVRRDRAVDESGNQIAVFGRRGARPFNQAEQRRLYLRGGTLYTVTDAPPGPPKEPSPKGR